MVVVVLVMLLLLPPLASCWLCSQRSDCWLTASLAGLGRQDSIGLSPWPWSLAAVAVAGWHCRIGRSREEAVKQAATGVGCYCGRASSSEERHSGRTEERLLPRVNETSDHRVVIVVQRGAVTTALQVIVLSVSVCIVEVTTDARRGPTPLSQPL